MPAHSVATAERIVPDSAEPIGAIESVDLGPLLRPVGDARLGLIGEASHGTSEFYRMRQRITRELIEGEIPIRRCRS